MKGARPPGRPTKLTPELAALVCARLAAGESLRQIGRDPAMPAARTVHRRLSADPGFRERYARARAVQAEALADEIIEIADDGTGDWRKRELGDGRIVSLPDHERINRSRLRVDARKWLMAKLAPKKYGGRPDVARGAAPAAVRFVGDDPGP